MSAAAILEAAARLRTLDEVVRWGAAERPALRVVDVVAQDEYTHDVVLGGTGGGFLVFDTT